MAGTRLGSAPFDTDERMIGSPASSIGVNRFRAICDCRALTNFEVAYFAQVVTGHCGEYRRPSFDQAECWAQLSCVQHKYPTTSPSPTTAESGVAGRLRRSTSADRQHGQQVRLHPDRDCRSWNSSRTVAWICHRQCDQFAHQEPGDDQDIEEFWQATGVLSAIDKIEVNG